MRVTSAKSSCLYAASAHLDKDQCDVFTIINWEMLSLVQPKSNAFTRETIALPRFVAIKSNYNGKYLRYIHEDGLEHAFVQFSGEEFVSPYTKYEVVMAKTNGNSMLDPDRRDLYTIIDWESLFILPKCVAFKDDSTSSSSSNNNNNSSSSSVLTRIFIGRSEKGRNQKQKQENNSPKSDMLFWPTKVGNNVAALRNLEVHLEVDETVTSRKIYNVNFRLRDARIYNRSILTLATEDAINRTQEPKTVDVKLSYSESKTRAWNSSISLKLLGVKTTIQSTVPLIIAEGKIELSGEFSGDYQWGQTESLTTDKENLYKFSVPPMTMVRVNLIATKASCDIPFSYEQLDTTTLTDRQQNTETIDDGIYTGSNYIDFKYETEQEKL
ncbi:uncharacterized protein LOC114295751 [Camellia sinensis]|uniref:uncharacterized protein LOC114295751 n=1 Tax=Camellia sinensis TaxID=4442 RepID=UPI001035EB0F|nr:uncharacterized protein LOC114295751 [Camellia sinensis]